MSADDIFLTLGLTSATAGLTLKRAGARAATIHPRGTLGDMLVEVLAGFALVMILVLMIYARGLLAPAAVVIALTAISWLALTRLSLSRFTKYQLPLAVTAFLSAIGYWLTEF